jgi:hypothetical protein
MAYWNRLPYVRHHTEGTLVQVKGRRRLCQLINGTWKDWRIDIGGLEKWGVRVQTLPKCWTVGQIQQGLLALSQASSPDYLPLSKRGLWKQNLAELVYNPYSRPNPGTSWFLRVAMIPPVQRSWGTPKGAKRDVLLGIKLVREQVAILAKGQKVPDEYMIPRLVEKVYDEYPKLPWKRHPNLGEHFSHRYKLLALYLKYLPQYYHRWGLQEVRHILPGRPAWASFLRWFEKWAKIPILGEGGSR